MGKKKKVLDGHTFKIIVVGEGGIGKTTLIRRYATNEFLEDTKVTIGAAFYSFDNKVNGEVGIKLQVWDFGGEKRFRFILPEYCNATDGVIFAFDLTRPNSLWNLGEWFELVTKHTNDPVHMLIGTKADAVDEGGFRKVNDEEIIDYMKELNFAPDRFLKTSALTGQNVSEIFEKISNLLYNEVNK